MVVRKVAMDPDSLMRQEPVDVGEIEVSFVSDCTTTNCLETERLASKVAIAESRELCSSQT
eukprot:1033509-Rhodomonas_salina.1